MNKIIVLLAIGFFNIERKMNLFQYEISDNCNNYLITLPYDGYFEGFDKYLNDTTYLHRPQGDFENPECFLAFHSKVGEVRLILSPDVLMDSASIENEKTYPNCIYLENDTITSKIKHFFKAYYLYNNERMLDVFFDYIDNDNREIHFSFTEVNPPQKSCDYWNNMENIKKIITMNEIPKRKKQLQSRK